MDSGRRLITDTLALLRRTVGAEPAEAGSSTAFTHNIAWLALKTSHPELVAAALQLRKRRRISCRDGVKAAFRRSPVAPLVYVTPSIDGWVLALGRCAPCNAGRETLDETTKRIIELSSIFEEAQAFSTEREAGYSHWILARRGQLERCFAYQGHNGELLADSGPITEIEKKIRFSDPVTRWTPSEADVIAVASSWSVDPLRLTQGRCPSRSGVLGLISQI